MASKCEDIIQAVLAKVQTVSGVTVYRSRWTAISRSESPAIVVRPEKEDIVKRNNDLSERELTLVVEVIARGTVPESVADQYCVSAHTKIMEDQTFSGKALLTREIGTVWESQEADLDAAVVLKRYLLCYRTVANTLT